MLFYFSFLCGNWMQKWVIINNQINFDNYSFVECRQYYHIAISIAACKSLKIGHILTYNHKGINKQNAVTNIGKSAPNKACGNLYFVNIFLRLSAHFYMYIPLWSNQVWLIFIGYMTYLIIKMTFLTTQKTVGWSNKRWRYTVKPL